MALLSETMRLSLEGTVYVTEFDAGIVTHFNREDVNWETNKGLVAVFVQNKQGVQLISRSQHLSQAFTDLRRETELFRSRFSAYADEQGGRYNVSLAYLHGNMDNLQAQITKHQSTAAQIERALRQIAEPGFLLTWLISELLGTLGITSVDQARRILDETYREEEDLRRQKDEVQRQANDVARQGSIFQQARHVLDALSRDVKDLTGRLDRFAGSWAVVHSEYVEMGEMLKNASTSASQGAFKRRLDLLANATEVLTADIQNYVDGLAAAGIQVAPSDGNTGLDMFEYTESLQFGGSDASIGKLFNDMILIVGIDLQRPIHKIIVQSGWVFDGIEVVYNLKDDGTQGASHGTVTRVSDRQVSELTLADTEYISSVSGKSGFADNGYPFMGDCVQQIQFEISDSMMGTSRTFGPLGLAPDLSANSTTLIGWSGRLVAFAGRSNDDAGQVGWRGIKFIGYLGDVGQVARVV